MMEFHVTSEKNNCMEKFNVLFFSKMSLTDKKKIGSTLDTRYVLQKYPLSPYVGLKVKSFTRDSSKKGK